MVELPEDSGFPAFVAQRIEHLTTDQKVGGSSPSKRTPLARTFVLSHKQNVLIPALFGSILARDGTEIRKHKT